MLSYSQRPVDWLEEADRQLYLTPASTGNNNDFRQRRRIDFVLVYSLGVRDSVVNQQRRRAFQQKLQSLGFEIEEQDIVGGLVGDQQFKSLLIIFVYFYPRNRDVIKMMMTMMKTMTQQQIEYSNFIIVDVVYPVDHNNNQSNVLFDYMLHLNFFSNQPKKLE